MNPSNITPEIIATRIFGWKFYPEHKDDFGFDIMSHWTLPNGKEFIPNFHGPLPTFLELEWTGPLLAKAAEIGPHAFDYQDGKYDFYFLGKGKIWGHKELNYAIAGAILEAMK